jgi:predicted DNA-binding transcriptional regulator YafY
MKTNAQKPTSTKPRAKTKPAKSFLRKARHIQPRLLQIIREIRAGGYPNAKTLAPKFNRSADSIQDDIDCLRIGYGMEFEYDAARHGYYFPEEVTDTPDNLLVQFSESELRVALLGAMSLLACRDTGLGQKALKLYEKITALLSVDAPVDVEDIEKGDYPISFGWSSQPIYDKKVMKKVIATATHRRQNRMLYGTKGEEPEWRTVDPYYFCQVNDAWYLIAYCHTRKTVRTFAASRIHGVKEIGKEIEVPKKFNLRKYLKGAFGVISGTDTYRITARFDQSVAYLIRERIWAGQIKQTKNRDGTIDLHLKLNHLAEVNRWLMTYSGQCEVLEPQELRKMVSDAGLAAHSRNKME